MGLKVNKNKNKKKRSDRNHVIYQLTNTATNENYIGVVVAEGRAYEKSVHNRFIRHVYKAVKLNAQSTISDSIRIHGKEVFTKKVLHIVRGRAKAFNMESTLINEVRPDLNMTMRNR